jgi:Mrp family chromosome partitioning ATPase
MLLAPNVDGVLLVIKAGSTQKEVARRAYEILQNSSCNILGVVLNNVNNALPYYYDYSYYGYQYDNNISPVIAKKAKPSPVPDTYSDKKKTRVERK